MNFEVELYFGGDGDLDKLTVELYSAACVTEAANRAREIAVDAKAKHYTFGQPVARNAAGFPDYETKRRQ